MNTVVRCLLLGLLVVLTACRTSPNRHATARAQAPEAPAGAPVVQAAPDVAAPPSITVYPVVLGEAHHQDTTDVVAILLERGGLTRIEIETAPFTPDREHDFARQATSFAAFVAKRGLTTDFALFAAFVGSPREGVQEVRGALVDRRGEVVWLERQRAGEPAFDEAHPSCPMDCSVLLVRRLQAPLRLSDPLRQDAPKGRLAAKFEEKSGVPSSTERAAMEAGLAKLRAGRSTATVRVYPSRVGTEWSADGAARLAKLINDRGLLQATAVEAPLPFTAVPGSNEQRTLWTGARSIQEAVRKSGHAADYLLFTDYLMPPKGKAGAVHSYLLAPDGSLVIVDYQNSHHDDFARIAPDSVSDCSDLVALRLEGYLK